MERDYKELVGKMTLEEKAGMCSGKDFWHLKSVERLSIPEVMVSDGPHGLRKQEEEADHLGVNDSIKAVCFPAACATASSFNKELLKEMGTALGKECQAEGVSILLGPGVNIKRSPLGGRNFEYFSEDPYVAGQMAKYFVQGVQSQNVGTSVKHFAGNNQEYRRMSCSSEIDERTLREIYLPAFETVVKEAKPFTIMCSYNKLNGVFMSENKKLLTDILREEWGFEGFVVSDWGAVNDRVEGIEAGMDLEMPSSKGVTDAEIIKAVKEGKLQEEVLDKAVERILKIMFCYLDNKKEETFTMEQDHALAVKVEEESAVLLKNENHILPLDPKKKIAFLGEFAKIPRYQGGGSSHINAFRVSNALEEANKYVSKYTEITYEQGFEIDAKQQKEELLKRAVEAAGQAEIAVIFAGLPDAYESEGYDRKHMRLPDCQNELIEAVLKVQKNTVVVLHNGSPIEMPWAKDVLAILEMYLGGQGVGEACAHLLFGEANPSGKLAESFPLRMEDNPSYLNFPGDGEKVEYREGIYVGYRYYDKKKMEVLFPFGHGLSYTKFAYSNLRLEKESMADNETTKVWVDITNIGDKPGKEVVQLYVHDKTDSIDRPVRELKGFEKVSLEPGETKTVEFILDKRSFAWYHTKISDWYCKTGIYEIQIGRSSRDIVLKTPITITSTTELPFHVHRNTTLGELLRNPKTSPIVKNMFQDKMPFSGGDSESEGAMNDEMMTQMMDNMPLRTLRSFSGLTEKALDDIVEKMNHALKEE